MRGTREGEQGRVLFAEVTIKSRTSQVNNSKCVRSISPISFSFRLVLFFPFFPISDERFPPVIFSHAVGSGSSWPAGNAGEDGREGKEKAVKIERRPIKANQCSAESGLFEPRAGVAS